jgi:hypothetical protein
MPSSPPLRTRDRLAAGLLIAAMLLGCGVLWVGIPALCLWIGSKLTENAGTHFVVTLPMTLAGMAVFVPLLVWTNRLYLRVTGAYARAAEEDDPEDFRARLRGPLEPILIGSLAIAIVALFVWFFFFAENPSRQVI